MSKTIFLVKKDPHQLSNHNNWIIMDGKSFLQFIKTPEGQLRAASFILLPKDGDDDHNIVIECDSNTLKRWSAEENHRKYLAKTKKEAGYTTISYNSKVSINGEDLSLEEIIADPEAVSTEDAALKNYYRNALSYALQFLDSEEAALIYALFYHDPPMTQEEYADAFSLSRVAVSRLKDAVLDKLRFHMKVYPHKAPKSEFERTNHNE